ncbi:SLC13 family permease [Bacillus sp. T33-2]|uniref:SLC13 family permease n=1 Tax=Bacillus sp. T33-2 TaxID=2054168 RepID=UPI002155ED9A|nr:SLC13 family permease [Bacillus sp. T33-2]
MSQSFIALSILIIVYAIIISEKIHRTIIALVGGILMICLGVLNQEEALHHIDFNTLGFLIGMMVFILDRWGIEIDNTSHSLDECIAFCFC